MSILENAGKRWRKTIDWKLEQATELSGRVFGVETERRIRFFRRHGYLLHLRHPRSFNEKVFHRKYLERLPEAAMLADKFAVREWVASKGHRAILNEIYQVARQAEEIDFDRLPSCFVLKATHGSGWNILVRDKSSVDLEAVRRKCQLWLQSKFGLKRDETHYDLIDPKIIVELYLIDGDTEVPPDYKFFVFHGKCHYIQVDSDRYIAHKRTFYNTRWEPQPFVLEYPRADCDQPRPATLEQMLQIAEDLGAGLDFCRVDLYSLNDCKVYFGEITLTPGAGTDRFRPVSADFMLGKLW